MHRDGTNINDPEYVTLADIDNKKTIQLIIGMIC